MKYFKKNTSQRDEKKFMPTYTVGSTLHDDPEPLTEKETAIRKIEDSIKMQKDGPVSRLFSPLDEREIKITNHLKNYEKK